MMLPINLIYEFQLLERGVPVYCNGQYVNAILPLDKGFHNNNYFVLVTNQEIVYCHPVKMLSLSAIEGIVPNNSRWS